MGITAFPFSSVIDVPTARILGRDDAGTGAAEALTNTEIFALLATGTPSASTYLRGDGTWSTVSAGVGGSTGSVDNAVLRADGTGGATLQASSIVVTDNFTASPNATVNHASIQATGGTTNVSVSVVPKGTGSFSLQVPDGTVTGGNARGTGASDFQMSRSTAAQVASGPWSFVAGRNNTASGGDAGATAFGDGCTASGSRAFVCNHNSVASGNFSFAAGLSGSATADRAFAASGTASGALSVSFGGTATGTCSFAQGTGTQAISDHAFARGNYSRAFRYGEYTESGGFFVFGGDCQNFSMHARCRTANAVATEMFLDGASQRISVAAQPSDTSRVCMFFIQVLGVRSNGTDIAAYQRKVIIRNNAGTVTLVQSETIGTDFEDVAGTDLTITADNTNKTLKIEVTGIASQTWRWTARIVGTEIAPGT